MSQEKHFKNRRNYYRLLHVQQDAPTEVIKASYRTIMGKLGLHPDMGGTHTESTVLNEAYQTLCHPKKRIEYDFLLSLRQKKTPKAFASKKNRTHQPENNGTPKTPLKKTKKENTPKQQTKTSMIEMRNIQRIKQQGSVSYTLPLSENYHQGELIDLSPKGMQFISKEKIHPASHIKVRSPLLLGSAKVTNCREVLRGNIRQYAICLNFIQVEFQRPSGTFLSVKG